MKHNHINILALIPYTVFPPKMGGQKAIAQFYEHLQQHLPVILLGTVDNRFSEKNAFVHYDWLASSPIRYADLRLYFKIKKLITEKKITHLIIEHPYFGWMAAGIKKSTGIKLIVRSHNIEAMRFKSTGKYWWRLLWRYEKWIHQQADLSFFITREDRDFAIRHFNLEPSKTKVMTFGFSFSEKPNETEQAAAKKIIREKYNLSSEEKVLLFNGTLNYKPNTDALRIIRDELVPRLNEKGFKYKIIICGKNLPEGFRDTDRIIYAGFVSDINEYLLGADIFINPVVDGGGIKTKLVEALGKNLTSVSTYSGAIGIPAETIFPKLRVVEDGDWELFSNAILDVSLLHQTSAEFYDHFNWENITAEAAVAIKQIS